MTSAKPLLGTIVAALVASCLAMPSEAGAYLTSFTVDKCLAGKLKNVGKATTAYMECHAENTAKPDQARFDACLTKASSKLTGAFGKLDGKYPSCTGGLGNAAARAADVAAYATAANGDVGNTPGKCDVAKQKCLGKYVAAIMGCYARGASRTGGLVDNASPKGCTAKARAKLADGARGCLDKAAARGDCSNAGSREAPLAAAADAFIGAQACLLDASAGGCCPSTIEFAPDAGDPLSAFDWGWNGIAHDLPLVTGGTLTVAVTGAGGNDCSFAGPVANRPGTMANRRCTGDTATQCASDGDCTFAGGTCEFFWGPPQPIAASGISGCLINQIAGPVSGSVDLITGAVTRSLVIRQSIYGEPWTDQPCPTCVGDAAVNDGVPGGTCWGGARNGLACDAQGVSPISVFGATSLDCPFGFSPMSTVSFDLSGSTGTESLTLSAASPSCTASGYSGFKCACQTCNNPSGELCETDADCPMSGGNPGVCGGLRCLAGANAGAPCARDSECPGSTCSRRGEPTRPNLCMDDTTTPEIESECVDTAPVGDHHGTCALGPFFGHCAPPEEYLACLDASDCPQTATCLTEPASCFLDNGEVGNSIIGEGIADPPVAGTALPTIASVSCYPPAPAAAVNSFAGLPGPARLTVTETMKLIP
ncbi:MAG: hypothetical protein B6D46_01575 [Polyangiaceae bacterium UTPRO1]|jgi:hypothetical protein|nr:hypothetical protein [Myxococcales bacterium]OQY69035.1 MAG: hypothetical protein B6D46_01575 [Polyangiaceae bacterium UTPRO1]